MPALLIAMPYVDIGHVPHYYQWIVENDSQTPSSLKPVMVFVHGWGGSARYWESTAWALSREFDCLLYDLRGFGRSSSRAGGDRCNPYRQARDDVYSMETYAEELLQLINHFGLERVTLIAHSMGTTIATLFASRFPARVEQAILTCSGVFEYDPLTFKLFHQVGGMVVRVRPQWLGAIPGMDRLFMARFVREALPAVVSRQFLADYLEADDAANLGTMYTCVSHHASISMPEAFAAIAMPTLLVSGAADRIIPPELGRQAASLNSRIQYAEIPNVAHFPMLEQADAYLDIVQAFLHTGRPPAAFAPLAA